MAIRAEVDMARVEVNDEYGVTLWQRRKTSYYTTEEARQLGEELLAAAAEADRIEAEDRAAAFAGATVSFAELRERLSATPSGFDQDMTIVKEQGIG